MNRLRGVIILSEAFCLQTYRYIVNAGNRTRPTHDIAKQLFCFIKSNSSVI